MSTRPKFSEAEVLERYRIALENASNQSSIYNILSEFGYDKSTLSEGKRVYDETRNAYDSNKKETDEASVVYRTFAAESEALINTFFMHRKKAKVVFRKEPEVLIRIGINGRQRSTYVRLMENVKRFYSEIAADEEILKRLGRLKVSTEEIKEMQKKIAAVDQLRADYLKEKGESQDATQQKDEAFSKLEDWMSEFYAVAKIAMEDNPQLLESLGKTIRR